MTQRRGRLPAAASSALALAFGLALLLTLALAGCGRKESQPTQQQTAAPGGTAFSVLAGSELRDVEPTLVKAARDAGVALQLSYAGALDIVERVNAGEHFDAILPAHGAYPSLALTTKPLAREKLFYSRIVIGVKAAKARALGWDTAVPTWAGIASAAGSGQLRYAMTNPTTSNSGMSALFAVASAVAGKTEDLTAAEVDTKVLTAFMAGQALTAGSSGWLADAFVKDPSTLDAMVNYEAVLLRANDKLQPADRLLLINPRDGVISADYPLLLLDAARRADYDKLVAALKAPAVQRELAAGAFLRPSVADVPLAAGLSAAPVAELSFPNRLEVIDAVLAASQREWRVPATSIFVLDTSGSMKGERLDAMRQALKVLAGADATLASARYARFQRRERVVLISFAARVDDAVQIDFDGAGFAAAQAHVLAYADALVARGGTAIYAALLKAERIAADERQRDGNRHVSIVLLTDGENNEEPNLAAFRDRLQQAGGTPARVFPILFGEASQAEMAELAQLTGGRLFDGRKAALAQVFKDIRGYQ